MGPAGPGCAPAGPVANGVVQRLAFDVDRFVPVSPVSAFFDRAVLDDLEAFAPPDFAELPFASAVFRLDDAADFRLGDADSDRFGATLDFTAAAADLAAGNAAATPAAFPAVDRDLPLDDLARAPEEELFRLAVVLVPRDPVTDGSDSLTVSSAVDPASLTASAPSETASPTDRRTLPAPRPTPRADRLTTFATAPAASVTGSVTRSRVPLLFLALLMMTS